jgi:nicotinamidase-related amidase
VPLLDRSDSLVIVIDAQPGFYTSDAVQDSAAASRARDVAGWLAGVAIALEVPVVVTEEDPARNGPTDPAIMGRLAPETKAMIKPVFGLADVPEILAAVEATGRRTAVLVGCETDVCVGQSAIGLLDRGYRVLVVSDATFSPGAMHDLGLRRIREQGGEVGHAKGVYYEWLRTLDAGLRFEAEHPDLASPPGFSL